MPTCTRYLDSARRQAELESEAKGLEQDIKATEERISEQSARLSAAEHQASVALYRIVRELCLPSPSLWYCVLLCC